MSIAWRGELVLRGTDEEHRFPMLLVQSGGGFDSAELVTGSGTHRFVAEPGGTSRWHELFGTPERAARTLVDSCNDDYDYGCGGCPVARANCKCGDYDALLEWLRGDAL